jgi:hypothetical protein
MVLAITISVIWALWLCLYVVKRQVRRQQARKSVASASTIYGDVPFAAREVKIEMPRHWHRPEVQVRIVDSSYSISGPGITGVIVADCNNLLAATRAELLAEERRLIAVANRDPSNDVVIVRLQQVRLLRQTREVYGDRCVVRIVDSIADGLVGREQAAGEAATVPAAAAAVTPIRRLEHQRARRAEAPIEINVEGETTVGGGVRP